MIYSHVSSLACDLPKKCLLRLGLGVVLDHISWVDDRSYFLVRSHIKPETLILWYILTTFSHKHGSFALSVDDFKKIHQKLKSLNVYER